MNIDGHYDCICIMLATSRVMHKHISTYPVPLLPWIEETCTLAVQQQCVFAVRCNVHSLVLARGQKLRGSLS